MNPERFYIPRIGSTMNSMIGASYLPTRGSIGLFGRLANSFRSFNWSGLLNGANKTLNVVNQTIPLVRQVGPMLNNMKSMFKIAKAFGSETTSKNNFANINRSTINKDVLSDNKTSLNMENLTNEKEVLDNNYPNFFI